MNSTFQFLLPSYCEGCVTQQMNQQAHINGCLQQSPYEVLRLRIETLRARVPVEDYSTFITLLRKELLLFYRLTQKNQKDLFGLPSILDFYDQLQQQKQQEFPAFFETLLSELRIMSQE